MGQSMGDSFDVYEGIVDASADVKQHSEDSASESSEDSVVFLVDDAPEALESSDVVCKEDNFVDITPQIVSKSLKYAERPSVNSYLLLSNLEWYLTQSQVYQHATSLGAISYLHLFEHPLSGKFLGVALIQYSSVSSLKNALESLPQLFSSRAKVYELNDDVYNELSSLNTLKCNCKLSNLLINKLFGIAKVPLPTRTEVLDDSNNDFERIQQQLIDSEVFKPVMKMFPWFQFDIFKILRTLTSEYKNKPNRRDYIDLKRGSGESRQPTTSPREDSHSKHSERYTLKSDQPQNTEQEGSGVLSVQGSHREDRVSTHRSKSRSKGRYSSRRSRSRDRDKRIGLEGSRSRRRRSRSRSRSHERSRRRRRSRSRSRGTSKHRSDEKDRGRDREKRGRSRGRDKTRSPSYSPNRKITIRHK